MVIFLSCFSLALADSKNITIEINDYPPFVSFREKGHGILTEISSEVWKGIGIEKMEVTSFPLARLLLRMNTGKTKASICSPYSTLEDFREKIDYVELLVSQVVYFCKNESCPVAPEMHSYERLRDYPIAILLGVSGLPKNGKMYKKVHWGNSLDSLFQLLIHDRVKFIGVLKLAGIEYAKKHSIKNLVYSTRSVKEVSLGLCFVRAHPEYSKGLVEQFKKELLRLKKSGKYQKIIDKYYNG